MRLVAASCAEMRMRHLAIALALLAVGLLLFGWWGLCTTPGRRRFDEMAGMIPFFAGSFGALLLTGALGIWWLSRRRDR